MVPHRRDFELLFRRFQRSLHVTDHERNHTEEFGESISPSSSHHVGDEKRRLSRNSDSQLEKNLLGIEDHGELVEGRAGENGREEDVPYGEPDHLVASALLYVAVADVALERREELHDWWYYLQRCLKYKTRKVAGYDLTHNLPVPFSIVSIKVILNVNGKGKGKDLNVH